MAFNSFRRGALPARGANISHDGNSSAGDGLPDGILDTLSPLLEFNPLMKLFMLFYNLAGSRLGIDPTYILTFVAVVWAANKLCGQLYTSFYDLARRYFMARIEVSDSDDIYLYLKKWLSSQPAMVNSRSLTAETASKGAWDEEESELMPSRVSPDGAGIYLNFSKQEAKAPPRFIPAFGLHTFWFRGRYFKLQRKQDALLDMNSGGNGMPQVNHKETLVISCFGRSPEPIKQLLQHAKEQYYLDHRAKTIVRRPSGKGMRRYGHRHSWQQVADRPVRPMKTVVLDDEQKVRVLSDMNEYLHPATPRWYANRGIPLRRGYLFHGPPGTGKTSLSFALAGVFGLDIYVISLLDPTLTEEELLGLFTSLPRRCVVLLEDIDTAGLKRSDDDPSPTASPDHKKSGEQGGKEADSKDERSRKQKDENNKDELERRFLELARELKRGSDSGDKKEGISLSGLLNAIDGVASHEGRVLIMTTNKPETLDEALIRPGRVDLQVAFTNATQEQARELFVRMYEPDSSIADKLPAALEDHPVSPLPPLTPFSEPPPTPFSLSSEKDGNMTDVSGPTEVDEDTEPSSATTTPAADGGIKKPTPLKLGSSSTTNAAPLTTTSTSSALDKLQDDERTETLRPAELARLAAQFASKIPGGQFSPAELQGFLLKRKKSPQRALMEVDFWVKGMLAQKAGGSKILAVQ
ncbi:BCS1 N terminal-domain-containing protein [Chaetomium strumarium]|uniref:BCS1 N terminal-domain-containing protein n=1 Tax=Chaetomium strumarium TaxID=1170767 RepID=A0AAJ0GXT6_9PEZI|nr:BCS1 N terminal-domain-containing protein [Chaetomium strumarium]